MKFFGTMGTILLLLEPGVSFLQTQTVLPHRRSHSTVAPPPPHGPINSVSLAGAPKAPPILLSLAATLVLPALPASLIPSKLESLLITRIIVAGLSGLMIGYERSLSDQPAGVRTMSLVAMGSCLFTLCGAFGFQSHVGKYDASRLASAVASGVGFIGAGVITTGTRRQGLADRDAVHGMTTAAAIWVSAAVGVCSGVGFFHLGVFAAVANVAIMRVGKRADLWARNRYKTLVLRSLTGEKDIDNPNSVELWAAANAAHESAAHVEDDFNMYSYTPPQAQVVTEVELDGDEKVAYGTHPHLKGGENRGKLPIIGGEEVREEADLHEQGGDLHEQTAREQAPGGGAKVVRISDKMENYTYNTDKLKKKKKGSQKKNDEDSNSN